MVDALGDLQLPDCAASLAHLVASSEMSKKELAQRIGDELLVIFNSLDVTDLTRGSPSGARVAARAGAAACDDDGSDRDGATSSIDSTPFTPPPSDFEQWLEPRRSATRVTPRPPATGCTGSSTLAEFYQTPPPFFRSRRTLPNPNAPGRRHYSAQFSACGPRETPGAPHLGAKPGSARRRGRAACREQAWREWGRQ